MYPGVFSVLFLFLPKLSTLFLMLSLNFLSYDFLSERLFPAVSSSNALFQQRLSFLFGLGMLLKLARSSLLNASLSLVSVLPSEERCWSADWQSPGFTVEQSLLSPLSSYQPTIFSLSSRPFIPFSCLKLSGSCFVSRSLDVGTTQFEAVVFLEDRRAIISSSGSRSVSFKFFFLLQHPNSLWQRVFFFGLIDPTWIIIDCQGSNSFSGSCDSLSIWIMLFVDESASSCIMERFL